MQSDIIVKKPPVTTETEITQTPVAPVEQPSTKEAKAPPAPKNSAPVGIIMAAVFICFCLIAAAIYSYGL